MARGAEEALGVAGLGFPADAAHGLALRNGVLAGRGGDESTDSDDPRLPPLRLGASYSASDGAGRALASPGSSSSSSSDAFLSDLHAIRFVCFAWRSGLLNPYGAWSPTRAPEASEFGTAREYDTTDLFFGENWLYDDLLFHREPEISGNSGDGDEEDKFIVGHDVADSSQLHLHRKGGAETGGCAEVYTSPPCSCCHGKRSIGMVGESVKDSWSAVYGRYQIMDDLTEVLDECGADALQFRRNANDDATHKVGPLVDSRSGDNQDFDLSALEKGFRCSVRTCLKTRMLLTMTKLSMTKFLKNSYSVHPFPEIGNPEDIYEMEDLAHDLRTGMDVCLKIIKNDKDFFDQSLDEIKLLKFVNKHDPADAHHILRLYDFFYYQAIARQCLEALVYLHDLNIVHCVLKPENISCFLTDNLSVYVQSRSYRAPEIILGLPYDQRIDIWSLGLETEDAGYMLQVLFLMNRCQRFLLEIIGTIGPIDTQMLALGQETHKYFTEEHDLFHKSEETGQLEYLIPEKSSCAPLTMLSDSKFVDFLSCLLQINPRKRPTARKHCGIDGFHTSIVELPIKDHSSHGGTFSQFLSS
ncbi:hypothetical protein ZWY2020_043960 [Hordeum vulgare]|nr:hypothetical protein ZWY2020_043960 [Hordeum vulgare]